MAFTSENEIEELALQILRACGWETAYGPDISPEGSNPLRQTYSDVVLLKPLRQALQQLNPQIPAQTLEDWIQNEILGYASQNAHEENRRIHRLITQGSTVQYEDEEGYSVNDMVQVLDWDQPARNQWLAVNQFTIIEQSTLGRREKRRPDIVLFVNGLPLGLIELKNAASEDATIHGAFTQVQAYKELIPNIFRYNCILLISDGLLARVGTTTAAFDRFMPWRSADGQNLLPKGRPELETALQGVFTHRHLLDLVRHCMVYTDSDRKVMAGYHQYFAVRKAVKETLQATDSKGDKRVGVVWHTQGSGKSLSMVFYAGWVVSRPELENPTLLILTDRVDLDNQLYATFSKCQDLLHQTPKQASARGDLQSLLNVASGGILFSKIQLFLPAEEKERYPVLSQRRNVIVVADEAHRSQYGFLAKLDKKTGKYKYGFAKYVRDALPNASFLGFTGTPIESEDVNTRAVFGDYIDTYDIQRAVDDGATVPLYYESRLAKLELNPQIMSVLDEEVDELTEDEEESERQRQQSKWSNLEAVVGSESRLQQMAQDLVKHWEARLQSLDGKAMIVCMSRRICVALYNALIQLKPEWHSDDIDKGVVKIIMTGDIAKDPSDWKKHFYSRSQQEQLANRTRDPKDPLKLVIVRDMWLTGFDAPCMHTMYVDKPMRGHGLMQAIARVNRVFKDKPAGLIVDYIGIGSSLKKALSVYTDNGEANVGIDTSEAVAQMLKLYEIIVDMFHGFDYKTPLMGSSQERLVLLADAMEFILDSQQKAAEKETDEEKRKAIRRAFPDHVLALSKAYALAATEPEAQKISLELAFFQAVSSALTKKEPSSKTSREDRDLVIQQLVNQAVQSTEIIDILTVAGIKTPDISILSDDFLAEIKDYKRRNLALEALQKLLNGEIRSQARTNVVQSRKFSERLAGAVAKYHNNALTTAELLEELIALAKDVKAQHARSQEEQLSEEEIVFYDALAESASAREVMGDKQLRVIATALVESIRNTVTVDWTVKNAARARLRIEVRKVLKRFGYPPDLADDAVKTVIEQAEVLAKEWS